MADAKWHRLCDAEGMFAAAFRLAQLILLVALLAAASCQRGAAMDSSQSFPEDARIAELANAAAHGEESRVRELVQQGADPNAEGENGITPLQFALLSDSMDGMRALILAGANPNRPGLGGATTVHTASMVDDPRYLQALLEYGADPNARHGKTGASALSVAAGPRTDAQFRMLLQAGADPDLADAAGNTALHAAAMINAGAHVRLLLESGASAHIRNAQGGSFQTYFFRTPDSRVTEALRADRKAVEQWLLEHGVPLETAVQ